MHHNLKIWPQYYSRVSERTKTFEVRKNDRAFQAGDTVTLQEFTPEKGGFYTGNELTFRIGYVHSLNENDVVFSLLEMP